MKTEAKIENTKRSIDELLARYDLEPSLDDIYVEGVFDKEVLLRYCNKTGHIRCIYEIDTVDIPSSLLAKYNLTSGNKQRVITLAKELSILQGSHAYACLVDKDLDQWLGNIEKVKGLRWTSYCSIEMHYFDTEIINDIIITTCKAKVKSIETYITSLSFVLTSLFAMRLTDATLSLNLRWLPFDKSLTTNEDKILIDVNDYITKVLLANSKVILISQFKTEYSNWLSKITGDTKDHCRGHDFTDLLAWSIREYKGIKTLSSKEAIERIMVLLASNISTLSNDLELY